MQIKSKKALSEVVSYVLLILIAITLSAVVFVFLKTQIPNGQTECPDKVSIIIKDYLCFRDGNSQNITNITFQNKGNFLVDGVFIRFSNSSEGGNTSFLNPVGIVNKITGQQWKDGFFYFGKNIIRPLPLSPNREYTQGFNYSSMNGRLIKRIQIQPFISDEKSEKVIICEKATITQEINNCN